MKKIKLKSIIDPSADNIDDIYSKICKELNLGIKNDRKLNQLESKRYYPNTKFLSKIELPLKKSNDNLIYSMSKSLNLAEQNLREANIKLKQKEEEIIRLKQRIKELEQKLNETKKNEEESEITCENCIKMNSIIEHQSEYITKLYNFMNENGILISKSSVDPKAKEEFNNKLKSLENDLNKLNEDKEKLDEDISGADRTTSSAYNKALLPRTIDIKVLARRIEEMNSIIYEEQGNNAQFESEDGKVFRLKQKKELLISFYKNGLIIEGYQFFPYESEQSQKIIQDIIDGYSPYILHDRYPKGVLMKVENHVKTIYEPNKISNTDSNIKSLKDPKEQKLMSPKEFVNIFPNKVIKNGNILNIREDMEKVLGIKLSNQDNNNEDEKEETDFNLYDIKDSKIKQEDLCKLKIKVVTVNKIINVNIPKNRHINELFDFIKDYANKNLKKVSEYLKINNINDYGFIMTFPFKILTYEKNVDKENTLEKCGLYPSLFITFDVLSKYQRK